MGSDAGAVQPRNTRWLRTYIFRPIVLELIATVIAISSTDLIADAFEVSRSRATFTIILCLAIVLVSLRFGYSRIYVPLRKATHPCVWKAVLSFSVFAAFVSVAGGFSAVSVLSKGHRPRDQATPAGFSPVLAEKTRSIVPVYQAFLKECSLSELVVDSLSVTFAVIGRTGSREISVFGHVVEAKAQSLVVSSILGSANSSADVMRYSVTPLPCTDTTLAYGVKLRTEQLGKLHFSIATSSIPIPGTRKVDFTLGYCVPVAMDGVNDGFFIDMRQFGSISGPVSIRVLTDGQAFLWIHAIDPKKQRPFVRGAPPTVRYEAVCDSGALRRGARYCYVFPLSKEYCNQILLVEYFRATEGRAS